MFPHMVERAIIPHVPGSEELKDNVSIINARDLKPLVSIAENVKVGKAKKIYSATVS